MYFRIFPLLKYRMFREISEVNELNSSTVHRHCRELISKSKPKIFTSFRITELELELELELSVCLSVYYMPRDLQHKRVKKYKTLLKFTKLINILL
jgi:hypothetical protein